MEYWPERADISWKTGQTGLWYWQSLGGHSCLITDGCEKWNLFALLNSRKSSLSDPRRVDFDPPITRLNRITFWAKSVQMRTRLQGSAWGTNQLETSWHIPHNLQSHKKKNKEILRYFPFNYLALAGPRLQTISINFLETAKKRNR